MTNVCRTFRTWLDVRLESAHGGIAEIGFSAAPQESAGLVHFRVWPSSDMPAVADDVRSRGYSESRVSGS